MDMGVMSAIQSTLPTCTCTASPPQPPPSGLAQKARTATTYRGACAWLGQDGAHARLTGETSGARLGEAGRPSAAAATLSSPRRYPNMQVT